VKEGRAERPFVYAATAAIQEGFCGPTKQQRPLIGEMDGLSALGGNSVVRLTPSH
jgi:hypothetical protein